MSDLPSEGKAALSRNVLGQPFERKHGRGSAKVAGVADIERENYFSGNYIAGTWGNGRAAHGCDHALGSASEPFDGENNLGSGTKSIAAHRHRGGARMSGLAHQSELNAGLPGNGADDPQR